MSTRPILVIGPPRSATTWVGGVLGAAPGVVSIHEPDNEAQIPFALKAKVGLNRFPVLTAGQSVPQRYETLWEEAFAGRSYGRDPLWGASKALLKRATRHEHRAAFCSPDAPHLSAKLKGVARLARPPRKPASAPRAVVKTVNSVFALEWLIARFDPHVVVVHRHPFEVVASWKELGWKDCNVDRDPAVESKYLDRLNIPPPDPKAGELTRAAWQIGLSFAALALATAGRPDLVLAEHEDLCVDPATRFRPLFENLDLGWSESVESYIRAQNRPGTGTTPARVASDQIGRWRKRLSANEVGEIRAGLQGFPRALLPDAEGLD
jgi:Sulfotransferase family